MELRQYVQMLRKWLWLILLCTVAVGLLAYAVSKRSTPVYRASATLLVNQSSPVAAGSAYADLLTSERLARTYATLLTSQPVLDETAAQVGITPGALAGAVTVTQVRDTQLLELKVEGTDPALAAEVANTLPRVFIARNEEMQLGLLGESKTNLEREMAKVEADLAQTQTAMAAAKDDTERIRLETSLAQYRSTYSNLVNTYQQIKIAQAESASSLVVAAPAGVPQTPIRPRTATNTLLAALLGAALAAGIAFLIEYLDDTIKTPDDISRVCEISTLGAIARLKDASMGRPWVAWVQSKAPEAEAYRTLRTNIQFSSVDKPVRTLLVTSPGPSEGKSTTASHLAVVMAQTGQRVLLVDTDLRRPALHRVFGLPNNTGLTTALLQGGDGFSLDGHIQPTEVEHLSILTSGPIPPNPSELLGSHRMGALIEKLSGEADIVIFDSPPVLPVTDAAVLGRQIDGVVIVADAGQTREQALGQAVAELRKTGAKVLGAVLNRLDSRSGTYYHYYYYYNTEGERQRRRSLSRTRSGLRWSSLRKLIRPKAG